MLNPPFAATARKKACVIFGGITYLPHYHCTGSFPGHYLIDYEASIKTIKDNIIEPLKEIFDVTVILSSYHSEKESKAIQDFGADIYEFVDFSNTAPMSRLLRGVQLALDTNQPYDFVFIARIDMNWKMKITEMLDVHDLASNPKFYFPWRECYAPLPDRSQLWREHNRVGNAFIVCHGQYLNAYLQATLENRDTHLMYRHIIRHMPEDKIHFVMNEGFCDSNSSLMPNPYYEILRLPVIK